MNLNLSISALFVRPDSVYKSLLLDCYDIARDGRSFSGFNSVICHPPCRAWGRLKHFAKPRHDEKELALFSIDLVRSQGGVLEHPRSSSLWHEKNIPILGGVDSFGGFCISLNQSWFGHQAQKATILYICGLSRSQLPAFDLDFSAVEFVVSTSYRCGHPLYRKGISKAAREGTPLKFALFLIAIADICYQNKINKSI